MTGRFAASIRAEIPEGWFVKESITILAPDGQGNVIASIEPLDPTIGSVQYATVQGDLLRNEFPRYTELRFEESTMLGGRQGFVREFTWVPPDGVPVRQVQMYVAHDGRGFTCTATAPGSQFERFAEVFALVQASLRAILAR